MFLRWFEYGQVFRPMREWVAKATDLGRPVEDIWLTATDGVRLSAWFFPGNKDGARADYAVLVCHGNAGNISHRLELCSSLLRTGVSVLLFDYRGYGHSEGRMSEEGTYCDAEGAYDWLGKRGFESQKIILFGESLGGGVASELALRETVGGLILQSTFTSIADVGAELFPWLPVRWLSTIKYDTLKRLPQVHAPVMVTHSRDDLLVRFHHAEKNFAAANEPKMFWETNCGHSCSSEIDYERCVEGVEKFLAMVEETNGRNGTASRANSSRAS